MKRISFYILVYILIFLVSPLVSSNQAKAAGSIYLAPSGATIAKGSSFYVSVRVNTGGKSVDSVQANLSYPTDKLDYLGVSYGGTGFEIQAESSGGGGSVRMGRGTLSAKSGDVLVGTVTFSAKVNSGSALVSFTSGSEAVKGGSTVVSATSSGTYSFTNPAPAPKAKPKDKTAPKIAEVKVSDIGLSKAVVTWKTNEKATSVVEYGPSEKLGIIASKTKLVTTHKISLSSKLLFPGTKYFYQVKSKDAAGNEAKSKLASFKTKGYRVKLTIIGSDGKPLANVKVRLIPGLEETTSNEAGVAEFTDLAPGEHSAQVQIGNQVLAQTVKIAESEDPDEPQNIQVKVAAISVQKQQTQDLIKYGLIFALGLVAAFLSLGLFWAARKRSYASHIKPKKENQTAT